jgi:hypothetical protein
MAGVGIAQGSGSRRALDSEINMIPMIDLLMVTISFLLITAVWTHLARVDASASVPGIAGPTPDKAAPRLHVELRDPARFVLHWNDGPTVLHTTDVPRQTAVRAADGTLRFPELAAALDREWRVSGSQASGHRPPSDRAQDALVLHTSDDTPYSAIIAAMDAAYAVRHDAANGRSTPAFVVTFAAN